MASAYLIVICKPDTNEVINAEIWSSPEWSQSRVLPQRTFVLYETGGRDFSDAKQRIEQSLQSPYFKRYHWILPYMNLDRDGKPFPTSN